jgi:hypothetical protein
MQFKTLLQSKTFWLNLISVAYTLATGNVDALKPLHLDDRTTIMLVGTINIINRIWFTNSAINGIIK